MAKLRVTRKDVSLAAGVSTATVSNVLNNKGNVSDDVRRRVLEIIGQLDYKPNMIARSLITNKTYQVAIVLDDITDPHHSAIVDAFQREAAAAGYFVNVNIRDRNLRALFDSLISRGIEGTFLMVSPDKYPEEQDTMQNIEYLSTSGVKVVNGFSSPDSLGKFSSIQLDFGDAVKQAIQYLASLGHREIGLLSIFPADYPYDERHRVFIKVMREMMGCDNPSVIYGERPFPGHFDTGEQYTMRLLKQNPNMTAIIGTNDMTAIGCVSYLVNNGYRIPEDISVIAIGDVNITKYFRPALSAMAINHTEYGREAFRMLLRSIESSSTHISQLKLNLVERQTVGYCKQRV